MQASADENAPSGQALHAALLEYSHSPGKYPVALRQPPLLFASIREILQLAVSRDDAAARPDLEMAALRDAASFFTKTALFYPGADHYALMGLGRNFDSAQLKDHYRLLMRLTHPDFHGGAASGSWSTDAAVRVNLAYEVLSSAVRRRDYDSQLAASSAPAPAPHAAHRRIHTAAPHSARRMPRSRLKQLAIACSVVAAFIVLLSLSVGGPEAVHLVQRVRPPVVESIVAAVPEPPVTAATPAEPESSPELPPGPAASPLPTAEPKQSAPVAEAPTALPHAPVAEPPPPPARAPEPVIAAPARPTLLPPQPPPPAPTPAPVPVRVANVEPPAPTPAPPAPAPATSPAAVTPLPVSPPPRPTPVAGVTLAEAQPLLSQLLQQLESGRGERVIDLLDREARSKPGAQALSRQYDVLVEGMRPVRLSQVEFRAEPADGRLLVTGNIRLHGGEQSIGSPGKKIVLRAEFVSRDGTVVMTALSGVPGH